MFYKDFKICEVCKVYKVFSKQGNVSTPVPVTDGSGILCWVGEGDDLEASQCFHNQNMCGYLLVSNTSSLLRELVSTTFMFRLTRATSTAPASTRPPTITSSPRRGASM